MKVARAKGHLRGKQPKLNHRQAAHLLALFDTGDHSTGGLRWGGQKTAADRATT